ncbi:GntR family transcriptional regulator [Reichenbachiella ulvae]|uniref:GntR family transcriptional regulator n=1 Tax=Reichenbachiella ulvae TaxID=2980104 RepID=A0ABT3CT66_9BACT|nr:GntR family transcriptional regulator [Reichenbachiella ulvae]MCV9386709.1 GntR family transcriptional regulator [Reichenbachiella ulvae]
MEHLELVDRIYAAVKQKIFDQELQPGQKITQEKIAAELGVSRSPLLKALQRLETEMLVESIPRRGMYVKSTNINDLIDVFECRAVLEGLSARLTARNITQQQIQTLKDCFSEFIGQKKISMEDYASADRAFHAYILEWSGNQTLSHLEMLSNIHLKAFQAGLIREPKETLTEHLSIIEALENRDQERAEKEMRKHIEQSLIDFKGKLLN